MPKILHLTPMQRLHKAFFTPPKHSLSRWAVKKIEYAYEKESVKLNFHYARFLRLVIAVAMPVFALLDTLQFLGKATFKLVTLKPKGALFELMHCYKSSSFAILSLLATPVAVASPKSVYRSKRAWRDIFTSQVANGITSKFEALSKTDDQSSKDRLKKAMQDTLNAMVPQSTGIDLLRKVVEQVILEIPDDPEKSQIVIEQYIDLFATLLAHTLSRKIPLDKAGDHFGQLMNAVIKIRKPEMRVQLLENILKTYLKKKDLYEAWTGLKEKHKTSPDRQDVALFIARQITNDNAILDKLLFILKDKFFKNKINLADLLSTHFEIKKSGLSPSSRTRLLKELLDSFQKDTELSSLPKLRKQRDVKQKSVDQLKAKLDEMQSKGQAEGDLKQKKQNLAKQEKALEELNRQIAAIEPKNEGGTQNGPNKHYAKAREIIGMMVSLGNQKMLDDCFNQIGDGKRFSIFSDHRIVGYLFSQVFGIPEESITQELGIGQLRAPWALVQFHSRLSEEKGRVRNDLLAASKSVVESVIQGTLWEDRHDEKNNPHLAKVYSFREDLKGKWMNPPQDLTVKDLVPSASDRYKDYQVIDCTDPTDILLIGNEMNTCVHLSGRLKIVEGLIGYIKDGKTHTFVAKDERGQVAAETQLQLMWDSKNNKPILFLEQVNFKGRSEKDYSLENALIAYAKQRAKDLELDLVSRYPMKDPSVNLLGKTYQGSVVSLGSSAPLEYVNSFYENRKKTYVLPTTRHVRD